LRADWGVLMMGRTRTVVAGTSWWWEGEVEIGGRRWAKRARVMGCAAVNSRAVKNDQHVVLA